MTQHDAKNDTDSIGDHHAGGSPQPNGKDGLIFGGEGDRGQLGLVTHLSDEKSDGDSPERAELVFFCFIPQFVAADGPDAEQDEGKRCTDLDRR